jgi:hypothetical protein
MAAAPIWCQGGLPHAGLVHSPVAMARKDDAREKRLAEALRENLRRRKAQAREQAQGREPSRARATGDPDLPGRD